jgi:membrane-bound metal-dependent hydrolase YbcI (DUF457 family)
MFLGHMAIGLAARQAAPRVSLATWFTAVQLVDLIWPVMLLLGFEHVRIAPGITAFTPLDFYDYPITHSLVGGTIWAALFAGLWLVRGRDSTGRVAMLLAAGVLSHWVLDAASHRPDVPVLPHGPYVGLGLWNSVPATIAVELTMFAAGLALYVRSGAAGSRRVSFWLLISFLIVTYFAAAFGPPPPDVRTLAWSALGLWLLIPWARWADR